MTLLFVPGPLEVSMTLIRNMCKGESQVKMLMPMLSFSIGSSFEVALKSTAAFLFLFF